MTDDTTIDEAQRRIAAMIADLEEQQKAAWYNQPKPRRWHRCRTVQSGRLGTGTFAERCSCGGISLNGGPWMDRNSRRG